jgi:hypothetical protein
MSKLKEFFQIIAFFKFYSLPIAKLKRKSQIFLICRAAHTKFITILGKDVKIDQDRFRMFDIAF